MYKGYKEPFIRLINYWGRKIHDKNFTEPPIYIGGCGRSGTTLLLSVLSSHPEIFACPRELGLYHEMVQNKKGEFIPRRIDRLHRTLITNNINASCNRWCEKSPSNVKYIREISSYHHGDFRFLNIVRDGRDVILSKHPTAPDTYWVSPERWIQDVQAGLAEKDNPRVYTLRYEDLVLEYDREAKRVCDFLDIPFSDEIRNWHAHARVRRNSAYFGKVDNMYQSSIGKWKKPENQARVQELLESEEALKLLSMYHYEF